MESISSKPISWILSLALILLKKLFYIHLKAKRVAIKSNVANAIVMKNDWSFGFKFSHLLKLETCEGITISKAFKISTIDIAK